MSCCDETQPAAPKPPVTAEQIMAGLPQVVLAASDPKHPLASSIRNAMPLPSGKPYALPRVHDDGSLEYTPVDGPPPPDIIGFLRDLQNPWLFRPGWNECQLRMAGIKQTREGNIDVKMVCNNPEVPQFMKFVKLADCAACTKRKTPPSFMPGGVY